MKFCVLVVLGCILIVAVRGITDEMKELAATLHKTCVAETGVDEALITKVNMEKVLPKDEKLQCYLKCVMEQTGCLDDNGTIDVEAMIALIPDELKDIASPTIQKCGSKVGANHCENVWLTHQCYIEMDPDNYYLF